MVQFFETPTAGIYDNLREVNDYWAADHDAAQRRYADREARRTYASAQRRNMAVSLDNEQFYNENAGLLDDRTGMLAGIGQRNVPNAVPTRVSATAAPPTPAAAAPGPAQLLGAPGGDPATTTTPATTTAPVATTSTLTANQRARLAASGSTPGPTPVAESELTATQRQAWQAYQNARPYDPRSMTHERTSPNLEGVSQGTRTREGALRRLQSLGLDVVNGRLVRTQDSITTDASGLTWPGNMPNASEAGLQSDGNDGEPDADTDDGTSDYFQGINDTSTPLRPTPEMRMTQATAAHMFRRAQILAQHGDNNGADQAFGAALQSHLATVEQSRMLMYQAAAGGSRDAAAMLIADTSGLDPSRVQLQATPERTPRFIVRINTTTPEQAAAGTPPNWVSSNAEPLSRDSLIGTLLNLADRAGAAGRAELSANLQESMLRYQGTLQEIAGRERDNIRDNLTRAEIAQLDSQTRIALAQGEGRMVQDSQTGNIWLVRPGVDANGRPTSIITVLRTQDLPTPNVDDNRNETVPTPTATRVN